MRRNVFCILFFFSKNIPCLEKHQITSSKVIYMKNDYEYHSFIFVISVFQLKKYLNWFIQKYYFTLKWNWWCTRKSMEKYISSHFYNFKEIQKNIEMYKFFHHLVVEFFLIVQLLSLKISLLEICKPNSDTQFFYCFLR